MHKMKSSVKEYFSTLPAYIQESIMQSGVTFATADEMKQFVEHLDSGSQKR